MTWFCLNKWPYKSPRQATFTEFIIMDGERQILVWTRIIDEDGNIENYAMNEGIPK